jgi:uncharacterized repeat protein (TIGR03987 family)
LISEIALHRLDDACQTGLTGSIPDSKRVLSMLLIIAIVSMVTALVLYTIGVWGEKLAGILRFGHLGFFWAGFLFDTTGTTIMTRMAGSFNFNLHGVTGLAAIVLMLAHAIWATTALLTRQKNVLQGFHRFSLGVWAIWLVPFVSGMILAMGH